MSAMDDLKILERVLWVAGTDLGWPQLWGRSPFYREAMTRVYEAFKMGELDALNAGLEAFMYAREAEGQE